MNEPALKEALAQCKDNPGFDDPDMPWDRITGRAREEIAALVESDIAEIADRESSPGLKTPWTAYLGHASPQLLTRATAELVRLYCLARRERVRDSSPDGLTTTSNSARLAG